MSDYNEYDPEYDQNDNSGGSLRKQLEKALKANQALQDEASSLKSQIAQSKATEVLTAKGYPPAVARLAIKDGVDLSNEKALENWLTENGDLFAKPEPNQNTVEGADQEPVVEDKMPEGIASTYGRVGALHAAATPAEVNRFQAALAGIPKDATGAQVREALKAF